VSDASGAGAPMVARLLAQLESGRDGVLLRFGLANALLASDPAAARHHAEEATRQQPTHTAAWKLLGKACLATGDHEAAREAWTRGLEVARAQGDLHAVREMEVFMRRLRSGETGRQPAQ
jgi:Flp pilus assembly protein TadD